MGSRTSFIKSLSDNCFIFAEMDRSEVLLFALVLWLTAKVEVAEDPFVVRGGVCNAVFEVEEEDVVPLTLTDVDVARALLPPEVLGLLREELPDALLLLLLLLAVTVLEYNRPRTALLSSSK